MISSIWGTHRLLILLTIGATISSIDRQVFGLLMESIKREFTLSDMQLGVLSGPAFGVVYALCGIPLAALADHRSRRKIVTGCLAFFSVATIACGLSPNFAALAVSRMALAAGEAGLPASSQSMIADQYSRADRAFPMSVLFLSSSIGGLIGFLVGGWGGQHIGWRQTFVLLGIPGLIATLMLLLLLRNPPRGRSDEGSLSGANIAPRERMSVLKAWSVLIRTPGYVRIVTAAAFWNFVGYGIPLWVPVLLIRKYDASGGTVGTIMAFYYGLFGVVGNIILGRLARRFGRGRISNIPRLLAVSALIGMPLSVLFLLADTPWVAALGAILPLGIMLGAMGPTSAVVQSIVPPEIRGTAVGLQNLVTMIAGLAIGSPVIGLLSDQLSAGGHANSLELALLICSLGWLMAGYFFWSAAKTLDRHLQPDGSKRGE